ncbi:MAG: lipopolysaccharide heptosyltransferase II [Bacteroidota bacterium]|nr:lipopolysaccharide heptosyltransferase II [Bacteroidota bacterium]
MPESILIIRLSSLGDIILTFPLIEELRKKYPDARIDFVSKKEYTGILNLIPWLSTTYSLDTMKGAVAIADLQRILEANTYDHVLDLHNNFRSRKLCRVLRGKLHVINKRSFKRWLLVKTKVNWLRDEPDIIGRYFETAKGLGITDAGTAPSFGIEFHTSEQKKAALCPGARHWNKRWLPEYYLATAKDLIERGYHIEFFGSEDEREYCNSIATQLPADRIENLCGKISLAELPQRIAECSVAVTNDSGLLHIAAAVGLPTVAIFGPTVRELGFMPRNKNVSIIENMNLDCRPCTTIGLDNCPKGHFKCMKDLTPEMISIRITDSLSANPRL